MKSKLNSLVCSHPLLSPIFKGKKLGQFLIPESSKSWIVMVNFQKPPSHWRLRYNVFLFRSQLQEDLLSLDLDLSKDHV